MYSVDARKIAVRLYFALKSYRKAAEIAKCSISTLHAWVRMGSKLFPTKRHFFSPKFELTNGTIRDFIKANPFTTLRSIANHVLDKTGVYISTDTCSGFVKKLGITKKKAHHHHPLFFESSHHADFKGKLLPIFEADTEIHSVDECNFSERVLPNYGYCQKGMRLDTCLQPKSWKSVSLLLAVSNKGTYSFFMKDGSIKRDVFKAFCESLPSNITIVLDNCNTHKGIPDDRFVFTPSYSPQFNPVEMCFSKIKRHFRQLLVERIEFRAAIDRAIRSLTSNDIINCFAHMRQECSNA
jgi:transposase